MTYLWVERGVPTTPLMLPVLYKAAPATAATDSANEAKWTPRKPSEDLGGRLPELRTKTSSDTSLHVMQHRSISNSSSISSNIRYQ